MQEISDRNLRRIIAEPQSVRTQIRLLQWFWKYAFRTLWGDVTPFSVFSLQSSPLCADTIFDYLPLQMVQTVL